VAGLRDYARAKEQSAVLRPQPDTALLDASQPSLLKPSGIRLERIHTTFFTTHLRVYRQESRQVVGCCFAQSFYRFERFLRRALLEQNLARDAARRARFLIEVAPKELYLIVFTQNQVRRRADLGHPRKRGQSS